MESSQEIKQAKQIILSVRGKSLSIDERKDKTIKLAGLMLIEAHRIETKKEKNLKKQLAEMIEDEKGKNFLIQLLDQSFRTKDSKRVIDQIKYLIDKHGIPNFLRPSQKLGFKIIRYFGDYFPHLFTYLTRWMIRRQTLELIIPGDKTLTKHINLRKSQGIKVNLNRLGEAILGEDEAIRRLQVYLNDLANPPIECISVKISSICSQLNLLSFEDTVNLLVSRLTALYRAAKKNMSFENGKKIYKFVYLDMEEYRDLQLTVDAFKRVLELEEFRDLTSGIVLQSYLPDSYLIQQELTIWAMKRLAGGGAPIKIRIVKGANLAMEQLESNLRLWPLATYDKKSDVDANYKRMLIYGTKKEHAKSVHIGIASHNLFDIAFGLLLASENEVQELITFEMLEGMADALSRVVLEISGEMLLYCPAATMEEFQNAAPYLVRRFDENTAPGNFLREAFALRVGSESWKEQTELFSKSCHDAKNLSFYPKRTQNRFLEPGRMDIDAPFQNEADTDFSLAQNRMWATKIISDWSHKKIDQIPLYINEEFVLTKEFKTKTTFEKGELYRYSIADNEQLEKAIRTAVLALEKPVDVNVRIRILADIAKNLRLERANLIGAMILDNKKTLEQADVEVSEAIDFAEYYLRQLRDLNSIEEIKWSPKGVILVASPWNFPCSIALGGIVSAFVTGNSVIFKPAEESILVGFLIEKICLKAGVPPNFLQFILCVDEPVGSLAIKDSRINAVILTGATSTAKLFFKLRPGLDLLAETGGKNAMIITSLADRDLCIKDLIQSAFSFSGQKCSACSLAICEKTVYDDKNFKEQLKSAVASLKVGSAFDLRNKVNPLIGKPSPLLEYGLTELGEGEEWLLKPKQDENNPDLWSPGIRLHAKEGSISHQSEFFGPVLTLMRADDLKHAVKIANSTTYGLTSGLHSLDEREHDYWLEHIEAGNCYINRGITGAIVQRQPFGGCKESSFGFGLKAGGPNYLIELMKKTDILLPKKTDEPKDEIKALAALLPNESVKDRSDLNIFFSSIGSYAFSFNNLFKDACDLSGCRGQDNFLKYVPRKDMVFRVLPGDSLLDILRVIAAAMTCGTDLEVSGLEKIQGLSLKVESDEEFLARVLDGNIKRIRLLSAPDDALKLAMAEASCNVILVRVLSHGRLELLNYLREVAVSFDYHRYGNLLERKIL